MQDQLLYAPVVLTRVEANFILGESAISHSKGAVSSQGLDTPHIRSQTIEPSEANFGEPVDPIAALRGTDNRTTVMLRRVTRRMTESELKSFLQSIPGMQDGVEFIYLPKDAVRRSNRGFAFVNFKNSVILGILASMLSDEVGRLQLPAALQKSKLFYARIQGKGAQLRALIEMRQFDSEISVNPE